MRQDLAFVLRGLARAPLFTLVSVLTLGIAIGGTTATSSFVRGVLLSPLPYQNADRLVTISSYNQAQEFEGLQVWGPQLAEIRDVSRSFTRVSGIHYEDVNLSGGSGPEKVAAAMVLPDLLPLLGIEASLGRVFHAEETEGAAILTHRLWVSRFGGSPDAVGSDLRHDRGVSTIVGVLPPGIEIPLRKADVLMPMSPSALRDPEAPSLQVFARLGPGIALEAAREEMDALSRRLEVETNPPVKGWYLDVKDLRTEIVGSVAPTIWMLQAAVLLVLLIACANFAGLLIARGVLREKEFAVRRAMGASRSRIARLLLTECVIIAAFGGLLGVVLGRWTTSLFLALAPEDMPRSEEVFADGTVLAIGLGIAMLSGLLAGLVPAMVLSREAPQRAASTGSRDSVRLRGAFTVVQLGAALILTIGCGLLAQSLVRLLAVDVGFEPGSLLTMDVSFPRDRYPEPLHRELVLRSLLERLEGLPGVRSAGAAGWTLMTGTASRAQMSVDDVFGAAKERSRWPLVLGVSPGFFPAAGIPLVAGRGFQELEKGEVAIVNRRLAEQAWPSGDAVGRRIKFGGPNSENPWLEIVGVVESSRLVELDLGEEEAMFRPLRYAYPTLSLLVRTRSEPMSAVPSIRGVVSEIDDRMPLADIRTMDEIVAENVRGPRFRLAVVGSFTALAVGLASLGIYGVVAQWTASRRREIGVRMALGADRRSVLRLSTEKGLVLVALGTLLGIGGSFATARFLEASLFEVSSSDPLTSVLAILFLGAVTLVAALIPAARAATIDPAEALRAE